MKQKKLLFRLLVALYILLFAASWFFLFVGGFPSPLPMGSLAMLALMGAFFSRGAFVACSVAVLVLYGLVFLCLYGAKQGRRLASAFLTIVMLLDLAANVVFVSLSLWFLLTAAGDVILLFLMLRLSFQNTDK